MWSVSVNYIIEIIMEKIAPTLSHIFTCTRCGYCCQGETTVSLDKDDQERMIAELGLTQQEVEGKYWRVTGNVVQMKIVDHRCVFYKKDIGCTVHEGRPWRCGQWPLHPSILSDENNFFTIRESCPGINQDLNWVDFCSIFNQLMEQEEKLLC
ncbi:YkgJ family cysteine cluster protein [Candidatus Electrothrix laxa]